MRPLNMTSSAVPRGGVSAPTISALADSFKESS